MKVYNQVLNRGISLPQQQGPEYDLGRGANHYALFEVRQRRI